VYQDLLWIGVRKGDEIKKKQGGFKERKKERKKTGSKRSHVNKELVCA